MLTVSRPMGWTKLTRPISLPEGITACWVMYPTLENSRVSPSNAGKLKKPRTSVMVPLRSRARYTVQYGRGERESPVTTNPLT